MSNDETDPIARIPVPCDGMAVDRNGACNYCREVVCAPSPELVRYDRERVPNTPHPTIKIPSHTRVAELYAIQDCYGCSCGGWHGDLVAPVDLAKAQADGSELPLLQIQSALDDLDAKVERIIAMLEASTNPEGAS